MVIQKAYVNTDGTAAFICPHCGESKTADVSRFKNQKDPLKVRCVCKNIYGVQLEFRRSYRKPVNLQGKYKKVGEDGFWRPMIVKNISTGGCGFFTNSMHKLELEETIHVEFKLDDPKKSLISKSAIVRVIEDKYIGCQFIIQPGTYDAALGFYLKR